MTPSSLTRRVRRSWPLRRVAVLLLAVTGAAILLFPAAGAWFSDRSHERAISAWVDQVEQTPRPVRERLLAAARDYNAALLPRRLNDPYATGVTGATGGATTSETRRPREAVANEPLAAYERQLAGTGDVLAVVRIPSIDVDLPVRHGTGETSLAHGVGHLFGSSLPVGGAGTHAVLTAHSGQVGAHLFDDLHTLSSGDEFRIEVLGEELVYRVDAVRTVLPDEIGTLARVPGQDLVTLVTCTPTGVNSHRLLVRGSRVRDTVVGARREEIDGLVGPAGVPWWAVSGAGLIVTFVLLTRRLRADGDDARTAGTDGDGLRPDGCATG